MENAGLRIVATVIRADGSTAQEIVFDQRGLTYAQLLELQEKAVTPCAAALMQTLSGWDEAAKAKAKAGK